MIHSDTCRDTHLDTSPKRSSVTEYVRNAILSTQNNDILSTPDTDFVDSQVQTRDQLPTSFRIGSHHNSSVSQCTDKSVSQWNSESTESSVQGYTKSTVSRPSNLSHQSSTSVQRRNHSLGLGRLKNTQSDKTGFLAKPSCSLIERYYRENPQKLHEETGEPTGTHTKVRVLLQPKSQLTQLTQSLAKETVPKVAATN